MSKCSLSKKDVINLRRFTTLSSVTLLAGVRIDNLLHLEEEPNSVL